MSDKQIVRDALTSLSCHGSAAENQSYEALTALDNLIDRADLIGELEGMKEHDEFEESGMATTTHHHVQYLLGLNAAIDKMIERLR